MLTTNHLRCPHRTEETGTSSPRRLSPRRSLVVYRMAFGQPRQEDLVQYLLANLPEDAVERLMGKLQIDLRPRAGFWEIVRSENARVTRPTQAFVDSWLDRIFRLLEADRPLDSIVDDRDASELIRHRERALKGPRARLFGQRALELWNGAAGTSQLSESAVQSRHPLIVNALRAPPSLWPAVPSGTNGNGCFASPQAEQRRTMPGPPIPTKTVELTCDIGRDIIMVESTNLEGMANAPILR